MTEQSSRTSVPTTHDHENETFHSICSRLATENNCDIIAIFNVGALMLMCSSSLDEALSKLDDIIQAYVEEQPLVNPTVIPANYLMWAWDIINGDYSHLVVNFS